jgi:hypothetical protein
MGLKGEIFTFFSLAEVIKSLLPFWQGFFHKQICRCSGSGQAGCREVWDGVQCAGDVGWYSRMNRWQRAIASWLQSAGSTAAVLPALHQDGRKLFAFIAHPHPPTPSANKKFSLSPPPCAGGAGGAGGYLTSVGFLHTVAVRGIGVNLGLIMNRHRRASG